MKKLVNAVHKLVLIQDSVVVLVDHLASALAYLDLQSSRNNGLAPKMKPISSSY